jgi:hypothetical protein
MGRNIKFNFHPVPGKEAQESPYPDVPLGNNLNPVSVFGDDPAKTVVIIYALLHKTFHAITPHLF